MLKVFIMKNKNSFRLNYICFYIFIKKLFIYFKR